MHSGNMTVTIIIKRNAKMLSGLGTKNRLFARATLTVFFFFLTLTVIKADILRGPKSWTCQKQYYYVLPSDCVSILFCLFSPGQSAWGPCCTKVAVQGDQVKKAQGSGGLLLLLLYCHIPPSKGMEIRTLEIVREYELENPFSAGQFRDCNILVSIETNNLLIYNWLTGKIQSKHII